MPRTPTITRTLEGPFITQEDIPDTWRLDIPVGDTTHYDLSEIKNVYGTFYVMVDREQLAKSWSEIIKSSGWFYEMQEKGTEGWGGVSELEDVASDSCIDFCNSHRLIPVLSKCLNQAREIFSNRRSIKAELGYFEDDFSEEDGHVVIRLEVASDAETTSREYNAWVNWIVDSVKHKNIGLFTLTIRRV